MLSYYVIYCEKFRKILQRTEKIVLKASTISLSTNAFGIPFTWDRVHGKNEYLYSFIFLVSMRTSFPCLLLVLVHVDISLSLFGNLLFHLLLCIELLIVYRLLYFVVFPAMFMYSSSSLLYFKSSCLTNHDAFLFTFSRCEIYFILYWSHTHACSNCDVTRDK